jgi:hypothetical protein
MPVDYKKLAEPFPKNDWEWRAEMVGITNNKPWCNVVPYIKNRAIQERLDAVCGPENWKNEFTPWRDNAQLCGISIYDDQKKEWVTKWDGADNTQFQSTKGGISASMKRAAVQWGIGRHLYDEKSMFVECSLEKKRGWEKAKTKDEKNIWWNPNDPQLCGAPTAKNEPDERGNEPPTTEEPPDDPGNYVIHAKGKDWDGYTIRKIDMAKGGRELLEKMCSSSPPVGSPAYETQQMVVRYLDKRTSTQDGEDLPF